MRFWEGGGLGGGSGSVSQKKIKKKKSHSILFFFSPISPVKKTSFFLLTPNFCKQSHLVSFQKKNLTPQNVLFRTFPSSPPTHNLIPSLSKDLAPNTYSSWSNWIECDSCTSITGIIMLNSQNPLYGLAHSL